MPRYLILPVLFVTAVAPLAAQTTPFTKVADTATPIPGGAGNFAGFSNMISVDASGKVAFYASDDNTDAGIYLWTAGVVTLVADTDTAIPDGTGTFNNFSFFGNGIEDGRLAFRGSEVLPPDTFLQNGVYAFAEGNLLKIADKNTPVPSGTGNFTTFTTAYVDGTDYAFIASGDSSQQGIYVSNGTTLTKIADKTTAVPGIGGTYGWSSQLGFDDGNLAFWSGVTGGSNPGDIIGGYTPGGGLVTLASTATVVPGVGTNFTSFSSPADLSGTTVAFRGNYSGGSGIYTMDLAGGAITSLANTSMLVPFGTGTFTNFSPPSIFGDEIAIRGVFNSGSGIYLHQNGRLRPVITTSDRLDGKEITVLSISENALADGFLAFRADFVGGSTGIYRLTIADLLDPPAVSKADETAELKKEIKSVTSKMKLAKKAGQTAKVKRFLTKLKKLKKQLRQL